MNIDIVAGARPNFMKIASILKAFSLSNKEHKIRLIHTGQHYDDKMSQVFFEDLNIPKPDINLSIHGVSRPKQIGLILDAYDQLLKKSDTQLCIVVGDVNSTAACAMAAKNNNILVAHVEAGIRSGDRTMPEEINRILTDSISDIFFTTTKLASENLLRSGVLSENIHLVGNTMIDTLLDNLNRSIRPLFWDKLDLDSDKYFVLTLHRPSNVDNEMVLESLVTTVSNCLKGYKVLFPVHPRTLKIIEKLSFSFSNIIFLDPLRYLEFIHVLKGSIGVITDSGGISEEVCILNKPCITLRDSTERPETIEQGTNTLVGNDLEALKKSISNILNDNWNRYQGISFWDGKTGSRIVSIIDEIYA